MIRIFVYLWHLALSVHLPPGPSVADLEFERLNGVWVAESMTPREIERVTPALLRMWDSPRWEERERAFLAARLVTPLVFRSAVLATRHPSLEVSHRAERFLYLAFRCKPCDGTGLCLTCGGNWAYKPCKECEWSAYCTTCRGSGDPRWNFRGVDDSGPLPCVRFEPSDIFPLRP